MIDRILGAFRRSRTRPTPLAEAGDAELVEVARRRDATGRAAFSELASRHQQWLVRLLHYYTLRDRHSAEDIAQEALVRAFLALDRCPRGDGFRAWLRTIATRLAFNHQRDSKTRRRYHDAFAGDASPVAQDPHRARESREVIEHVLSRLSYPFREILVLRHVEDLSVKEIAAHLDIGVSAAKMRLARARADFNRIYGQVVDG